MTLPMATAYQIEQARALACYLVRALWRRIDWSSMPANRRRDLPRELADALLPLAVSERSSLGWCRALCTRFDINPNGGSFLDKDGAERAANPAYALVPRRWIPDGTPEVEGRSTKDRAAVQWAVVCRLIPFDALRIALHENPSLVSTFVTSGETDGEDELFVVRDDAAATPWTPTLPTRLVTPRMFSAVWTCTSPIHHGADEKAGNVSLFRRHRMVSPLTGEQYLVPFISGNAVRGQWRDMIMYRLFNLVGVRDADIPTQRAHALLAGGSIDKGADTGSVNTAIRRAARENCPPWDLLGGCIDHQIMRGLLRVHDAVLVCRENAWLLHERLRPSVNGKPLSVEEWARALKPADDLVQLRLHVRQKHAELEGSDGVQMLVNVEHVMAGTQWAHSFQLLELNTVSDLAKSCLADLLDDFRDDAAIGAKTSAGHGQIAFDPYMPGEGSAPLASPELYRRWVAENQEQIRAWLLGEALDDGDASPKSAKGRRKPASKAAGAQQGMF